MKKPRYKITGQEIDRKKNSELIIVEDNETKKEFKLLIDIFLRSRYMLKDFSSDDAFLIGYMLAGDQTRK